MTELPTFGPKTDLRAAVSLSALAVAAGAVALGAPAAVAVGAALLAAGSAVAAVWPRKPLVPDEVPLAVTDAGGTTVAANGAFAALMTAHGRAAEPDGLANDDATGLALHLLRRKAVVDGEASGLIPPFAVTITTNQAGHLAYRVSVAETAPQRLPLAHATAFVELIPSPAAVVAADGTIHAANPQYRAMAGEGDRLGDDLDLAEGAMERLRLQAGESGVARTDAALKHTPGRTVRLTAKAFPLPRGAAALTVTLADVTEQSELEAQIVQSQKMQAIGQLAGGIAHDFNNVLTAIIGFSDLLLQNHRPSDPAFRDIMNIKQNAQRAARLVKQLLAFSRRQTLRPEVLNLNDVMADLSLMLDRLLGETVKLDIEYGRDLWPVLGDLSQLEQVIINLSVNARDAMKGGGTLTVRTRNVPAGEALAETEHSAEGHAETGTAGDAVLIEIEDTGTGIAPDIIGKIFEPFFTTKATGQGTGLGLSTVYGIVKQTGGTLTVDSREGHGTIFRVYLPRTEAKAAVADPQGAKRDLTGSATLLLVEDEEAIRAFAARALEAKGYTVLSAASGVEAAEIFAERGRDVDLLLTDVIMPELDGPSLVRQVRAERADIKVIFMSGYADGASVDELGGASFLPKPFTLKALAEAVKTELSRS